MNNPHLPETTAGWIERAHSDLRLGRTALKTKGVLPEDACFHAQQCAEKALKGLLVSRSIPFPKTHVIESLLDLLKTQHVGIPQTVDEAFQLTQYAVQTRYPGDWERVSQQEAKKALDMAAYVLNWVENMLNNFTDKDT
jgi:HEPN domain-containing protein